MTKAEAASNFEARMWGIQVLAGTPGTFFSRLVQVLPPSRVTCSRPSSLTVQITPFSLGLGTIWSRVVKFSAALASIVRPPLFAACCHSGLSVVRSGLITVQEAPWSVDLWTYWLPMYTVPGSKGSTARAAFQLKRSFLRPLPGAGSAGLA